MVWVPGEPVPKARPRMTRSGHVYTPKRTADYEAAVKAAWRETGAEKWHERIEELLPEIDRKNLFTPQEAYMSKIRDTYRYSLVIKCPKGKRHLYAGIIYKVRAAETEEARRKKQEYIAVVDINPYSFS